tara:strand:- start:625 stop:819 length:195 start_codon:yes stop_codon:yes gene_type:complete
MKNVNERTTQVISSLKELPRFEGSHCPNQSNHEYVKRIDTGSYVRLEDVIKILISGEMEDDYRT